MSEIIQLQSSLARIFRDALPVTLSWENIQAIKQLFEINKKLNGVSTSPTRASITQVVSKFRRSRKVADFRDLKYICYGVAIPIQEGWCVLGDEKLRDEILASVESLNESRKRLSCFQALLSSYFTFGLYEDQTLEASHNGWKILREWLVRQKLLLQLDIKKDNLRKSGWFEVLTKHENLLTTKPCDRYGEDMLRGDNSSIEEARQGLGIPRDSWVMEETILSQMKSAASLGENQFKSHLDQLLNVITGQTSLDVSVLLKQRGIAVLISRYARCVSKPEHPALRDAAVSIIGNPWLKKTQWDAWVKRSDGQTDDEARKMINGWITRRLITDFFELLSADGNAVQKRLDYWLKYESKIEDLWFVLGTNAWKKAEYDSRYKAVKNRTDKSRWLQMTNETNKDNNAFVMHIGNKLVVEFGVTNNACFFYPIEPMPFVLAESQSISERRLKFHNQNGIGKKLSHIGNWEYSFTSMLAKDISGFEKQVQFQPNSVDVKQLSEQLDVAPKSENNDLATYWKSKYLAPNDQKNANNDYHNLSYVEQYAAKFSIKSEDHRTTGGAFWVCTLKGKYPEVDVNLESWGFKYKEGRGWWKQ